MQLLLTERFATTLTFVAAVRDIEERGDIWRTRSGNGEQAGHRETAVTSAGALVLDVRRHVRLAADVAVVLLDAAPAAAHAAVLSRHHHQDLVRSARRVERLRQTVLHRICRIQPLSKLFTQIYLQIRLSKSV